ncbi:MAG: sulfite exporter TauE/SafE family protein [Rhodocyclales bacterium]|nr:sulfite exporter TauE/SafE family protein [Rhodocyclales bacterium]
MIDAGLLTCVGIGFAIGIAMGLTGAGGGILAVPALVASMGWSMQQAAPVSLVAVACAASAGAAHGMRHDLVRYRAAFLMAAVSLPFSLLGVVLAHRLSQPVLFVLFAVVVILTAIRLLRIRPDDLATPGSAADRTINPHTGRFSWTWPTALRLAAMGAAAGTISGLLGVSGGFLVVPLLRSFTALSMQAIVATSLFVTALISVGSVCNAFAHGAQIPLAFTSLFAVATVTGMLLARRLGRNLPHAHVQRGFAILFIFMALILAAQAFAV